MTKRRNSTTNQFMNSAAGSAAIMLSAKSGLRLTKPMGNEPAPSGDTHISGTGLKSADSWNLRQPNRELKFAPGQHPGGHSKEQIAQFNKDTKYWGDAEWEAFQKMSRIAADSSWAMAHHNQPSQRWKDFEAMAKNGGQVPPKDEKITVNSQTLNKSDVAKFAATLNKLTPEQRDKWIEANKSGGSGSTTIGQGQHPGAPGANRTIIIKDANGKDKKITGNDLDKFANAYGKLTPDQQKAWNKMMVENHSALTQRGSESQSMKNFKSSTLSAAQAQKLKEISADPAKKKAFEAWVKGATNNENKLKEISADPAKKKAFEQWVTKAAAYDKHSKNAIFGKNDSPLPVSPVRRNVVR